MDDACVGGGVGAGTGRVVGTVVGGRQDGRLRGGSGEVMGVVWGGPELSPPVFRRDCDCYVHSAPGVWGRRSRLGGGRDESLGCGDNLEGGGGGEEIKRNNEVKDTWGGLA